MTNALLTILIPILIQVESNGNDHAIGDNGNSIGCLQLSMPALHDVNRIYGTKYGYTHRWNRKHSEDIATKYLAYWGRRYRERIGYAPSMEIYARIYNGGPNGWAKKGTDEYWDKVRKLLQEEGYYVYDG